MRVEDLSEPERRLWMGFPYGTHIDRRTGDAERDNPAHASSWGPDRIIGAHVIKDLLVGKYPVDEQQQREEGEGRSPAVFLSGVRITGALDLRGLDVTSQLLLQGCAFDEPLVLADSMCRSVRLYGCHLPGVQSAWLVSDGDLHLRDCHIHDTVDLTGALIGRQLVLSGSQLSNPGGVAISADGLVVMGDMLCRDGAVIKGEVSLVAARIGGELRFTNSALLCPGGVALRADRIAVEKDMHCRESFRAEGQVRLQGGHIKGQLNFNSATLSNPGKIALDADQIVVDSHLYCQEIVRDEAEKRGDVDDDASAQTNARFEVEGGISLVAAHIGGEVRFSASSISNPRGVALQANRLVVTSDMFCRERLEVLGEIDLRGAHIQGQLNFNNATLNNEHGIALRADGLVVDQHLYCQDNFNVTGGITLVAARVGGEVRFSRSTLSNPDGVALKADRLFVAEDMFCREGLKVFGGIDLSGAHIQGQLNFNNATLNNEHGVALHADGLVVDEHLYCQGNKVTGGITLMAARVGGEVRFSASTLSNPDGVALKADRLFVAQDMFCRENLLVKGKIDLRGAHVGGQLNLNNATLSNPGKVALDADRIAVGSHLYCQQGFRADGELRMVAARVGGEVRFSASKLSNPPTPSNPEGVALRANRLVVTDNMFCREKLKVLGEIDLRGAHVKGQLNFNDATLNNKHGIALRADGLVVDQHLYCQDKFNVTGEITLVAARIGGEVRFSGSTLSNPPTPADPERVALRAKRLVVTDSMFCREGLEVFGEIDLTGAQIHGQLNFNNATLNNENGIALRADGLVVDQHLYCQDRFNVTGGITLVAARIGGEVRFSASTLSNPPTPSNPDAVALRANRLVVTDNMFCREGLEVFGEIDLSGAHVKGQLNFNNATLNNKHGTALHAEGLVVDEHLYCQGNKVFGGITLVAARVGGEVRFSGSTLSNPEDVALKADRLFVAHDMFCRENLLVQGEINLCGAHVGGQLNFNNATLNNPGRVALNADQIAVGAHLYCQEGFRADGEVRMVAARVGGEVRFSASTVSNPPTPSNPKAVALRADRLVVTDDMFCREGFKVFGEINLSGAHIQGQLSFSTATISNGEATAIRARQLAVGSHLSCSNKFVADGLVDLSDAHIVGEFSLSGATLNNAGRVALLAPRLNVDNDMLCRDEFAVNGAICLIGAHVGGELNLSNARLTGARLTDEQLADTGITEMLRRTVTVTEPPSGQIPPTKFWPWLWYKLFQDMGTETPAGREPPKSFLPWLWYKLFREVGPPDAELPPLDPVVNGESGLALIADGMHLDSDMVCVSLDAHGEVRLKGARVAKNLDFTDAEVNNADGTALHAADVEAERLLMPARCENGKINLRYGKMTELDDKQGVLPERIDIFGLSYETLIPPIDPQRRLLWMRLSGRYEPQPYDQLARSYRRLGYDERARTVQLEQQRRRRDRLPLVRKWWGYLQDATIGYGYRPYRAFALLVGVVALGTLVFTFYRPTAVNPTDYATFNPFMYTMDVLVPVADFGERDQWEPNGIQEAFRTVLAVSGWVLASTAIAGVTRALKRS